MNNDSNNPHNYNSLTGDEFLDFLSWCEAVGIDFEGNNNNEEDNCNYDDYDYSLDSNKQILIKKNERKR